VTPEPLARRHPDQAPAPPDAPVWYVSYGSNMCAARFRCYLEGGTPPGGRRRNPGARDPSPPAADRPVDLPGTGYFAGRSTQWGGGIMFYDHLTPGSTAGRAYLVTAGQLCDVAAQEMHVELIDGHPLLSIDVTRLTGGRHSFGEGVYETLVEVGREDDVPLLTFTSPHGATDVPHSRPSAAYLAMVAEGLRESRDWDDERIAAYFRTLYDAL
jgi:hypothetical protein